MKKVLCLIDGLSLGGAERQIIGLAALLHDKGYDVTLAYYHDKIFYSSLLEEKNIQTWLIDVDEGVVKKIWQVYKFIRKGNYDAVIAYKSGPNMISCLTKMVGEHLKLIVSDRNTIQSVTHKDRVRYFLYKWADYVVPNSESQRQFICSHYPKLASKTICITNTTDIKRFCPAVKTISNSRLKIVTVARIAKQKNVMNYLRAIKKVTEINQNVAFDWYGNVQAGDEDYYNECLSMVRSTNIGAYVNFHYATNNIVQVYQECDFFLLPSLFEGYPNSICEAMSCGKPILCGRICDNPLIVREGENSFLFDPKNANDMSRAILEMLSKPVETRADMGMRSRQLAEEQFSEELFVEKYIRLIEGE